MTLIIVNVEVKSYNPFIKKSWFRQPKTPYPQSHLHEKDNL